MDIKSPASDATGADRGSALEVLRTFTKLGFISFGGPIAHLGYFRTEFVDRKGWLNADEYADLVSLCQFLPGPASSQVGMAVGLKRAGIPGAIAAWTGFTLPSAIALAAFALGLASRAPEGVLHGLMLVAVAVVAQALWQMAKTACREIRAIAIAGIALAASLLWPYAWVQIAIVAAALLIGVALFHRRGSPTRTASPSPVRRAAADELAARAERSTAEPRREQPATGPISRRAGLISLASFALLLVAMPLIAAATSNLAIHIADTFYRVGSMVFGGGHVVLPLLESQVVGPGWVTPSEFVTGYGAAQAVPGPLFTFAAYLGASMTQPILMALIAVLAIFLPSFLLVIGVMPLWERLRANPEMRAALRGVNAAVVGILGAAFYRPVITSAIFDWKDVLIALAAFAALIWLKVPPWIVVLATAGIAYVVTLI